MGILRSNNASFKITLEYMKKRGYVWYELIKNGIFYLFHHRMYSDHKIWGYYDGEELDHMYVLFSDGTKVHIKTIEDLDLLEKMWDEKNQKHKIKLKNQLIQKCKA